MLAKAQVLLKDKNSQVEEPLQDQEGDMRQPILKQDRAHELNYLCGVVEKVDLNRFQRIIFRVSKGNILTMNADIAVQGTSKCMFVLIFSGGQHQQLKQKLMRVCDSFGVTRFEVPRFYSEQKAKMLQVNEQI